MSTQSGLTPRHDSPLTRRRRLWRRLFLLMRVLYVWNRRNYLKSIQYLRPEKEQETVHLHKAARPGGTTHFSPERGCCFGMLFQLLPCVRALYPEVAPPQPPPVPKKKKRLSVGKLLTGMKLLHWRIKAHNNNQVEPAVTEAPSPIVSPRQWTRFKKATGDLAIGSEVAAEELQSRLELSLKDKLSFQLKRGDMIFCRFDHLPHDYTFSNMLLSPSKRQKSSSHRSRRLSGRERVLRVRKRREKSHQRHYGVDSEGELFSETDGSSADEEGAKEVVQFDDHYLGRQMMPEDSESVNSLGDPMAPIIVVSTSAEEATSGQGRGSLDSTSSHDGTLTPPSEPDSVSSIDQEEEPQSRMQHIRVRTPKRTGRRRRRRRPRKHSLT